MAAGGGMKTVGLVVPSRNRVMEGDFHRRVPPDVCVATSRVRKAEARVDVATLDEMLAHFEEAAAIVATARPDIILFGCTSASFMHGVEATEVLEARTRGKTGIPTVTTSTAAADCLRRLGVEKVAIFTPYVEELNEREREYFQAKGFRVTRVGGLGFATSEENYSCPAERIREEALRFMAGDDAALFVSCTNFRAYAVAAALARALGRPVVTSNLASLWASLRSLGHPRADSVLSEGLPN